LSLRYSVNPEHEKAISEKEPQRDILKSLSDISHILLTVRPIGLAISSTLACLQEISGAGRCLYFENKALPDGCIISVLSASAGMDGPQRSKDGNLPLEICWRHMGMDSQEKSLAAGNTLRIYTDDLPESERVVLERLNTTGMMAIPVHVRGRWHGFIAFTAPEKTDDCMEERVRFLETAALAINSALERDRIERETLAINRLMTRLAASATLEAMIDVIAEETQNLFEWDSHYLAVRMDSEERFRVLSFFDTEENRRISYPPQDHSESRPSEMLLPLLEGKAMLIQRDGTESEQNLARFGNVSRPSASLMYVPVRSGQRIIGIISAQSYTPGRYRDEDLAAFERVADALAPALERVFAEEKGRKTDARMGLIIKSLPVVIFSIPVTGRGRMFITPNVRELTGYEAAEIEANPTLWLEMISPEDRERTGAFLEGIRRGYGLNEPQSLEYRYLAASGETRWIRQILTPGFDKSGKVERIDGVAEDITDRIRAEQDLKGAHQIYRRAIENARGLPYRLNYEKGNYDFIGEGCEEILGIPRELLDARHMPEMVQEIVVTEPGSWPDPRAYIESFKKGDVKTYRTDIRILLPGGEEKWLSDSSILIHDTNSGRAVASVGILHDITERKRIEQAIQYRLAFEALITDIATNFINIPPDDVNISISDALKRIGEFATVDRAYIFQFLDEGHSMQKMFGWAAPGIHPRIQTGETETQKGLGWWKKKLKKGETVYIPTLDSLPLEAAAIRKWLEKYDVCSCVAVPMTHQGVLFGFLGFDCVQEEKEWSGEIITLLRMVGEVFVNAVERKRVEEALRQSEERYALAVRGANDGLWDWNTGSGTVYYSPRWKEIIGHEDAAIGSGEDEWFGRVHPDDIDQLRAAIVAHINGHTPHLENQHRIKTRNGLYRWVLVRGLAVLDSTQKPCRMVGSLSDIHEKKTAQERLLHGAFHDELTDLPNRALFMDRLEQALARSRRYQDYCFAAALLDLDRFKNINDSIGHNAGDQLLIAVARRLESCLRPGDTVSRTGGDEFLILMEDIGSEKGAREIADGLLTAFSEPFHQDGHEVFLSGSMGITLSSGDYMNTQEILRDADTAMYQAKACGKARYEFFNETMRASTVSFWKTEMDLRRAQHHEEFRIHYQPIIRLDNGETAGFEALARWLHPEKGMLNACEFIGVAEETGLIIPIGRWVMREACRQMSRWHMDMRGCALPTISVNLFSRQFMREDMVTEIREIIAETELAPETLKIEITESVIMENTDLAVRIMRQLKELNIQLQIDDFGTGYSSLSYIQKFPISGLKIDRSFVSRLHSDEDTREIIRAIIAMARGMNIQVIAEGVETRGQMEELRDMGCDFGQGYYFAKALCAPETKDLIFEKRLWK